MKSERGCSNQGLIRRRLDPRLALGHVFAMKIIFQQRDSPDARKEVLDMTAEGGFVDPPQPSWSDRLIGGALMLAGAGIAIIGTALAIWFTLMLIPFVIAAGLIGYAAFRWYSWRAQQSVGGHPFDRFRPR